MIISDKHAGCERQLDYGIAFKYWLELGTARKATQAIERAGYVYVDKRGKKRPFKEAAIRRGAWLWVLENPDKALEIWQSKGFWLDGRTDEWARWVYNKIKAFTQTEYARKKYLEINGLTEWYNENITKSVEEQ